MNTFENLFLNNKIIKKYSNGVISLIEDDYHDNFGFQWNQFNKLQLDSFNGSNESLDRLLFQSKLKEGDFKDKLVLELGAGNGRFTEILLKLGAKVVAVDYSTAINANYQNHKSYVNDNKLMLVRGSLFDLPLKKEIFDIVICYGVIQHTGNNKGCLDTISEYVKKDGLLLVDIYSNSIKHFNPFIYLIRPFFFRISGERKKLRVVENFVNKVFPLQLKVLGYLHDRKGIFKYLKFVINRSPNSVYGINLYLDGKISVKHAKDWSICDTYDAWMPKHDHPVSMRKWRKLLNNLAIQKGFDVMNVFECGQGNAAVLKKT